MDPKECSLTFLSEMSLLNTCRTAYLWTVDTITWIWLVAPMKLVGFPKFVICDFRPVHVFLSVLGSGWVGGPG